MKKQTVIPLGRYESESFHRHLKYVYDKYFEDEALNEEFNRTLYELNKEIEIKRQMLEDLP